MEILLLVVSFFLPAVGLSLLVRLAPPIYHLSQHTPSARPLILLVNGLLCFVLTAGALNGVLTVTSSWIAYEEVVALDFDASRYSGVPSVTADNVRQYDESVFLELELRQFFLSWGRPGQVCFTSNSTVCQLTDKAMDAQSSYSVCSLLALLPTSINVLLGWYWLRPRA